MSFSSFSLFSFYQQPNTGHQPAALNTGILLSGNAASGKVADFNWYFPYASTNILINSLLSQSRFGYHIWADSVGGVVPGIHYATVSTSFSGKFQANYDSLYFTDSFYGTVYPQFKDLASGYSSFSGIVSGAPHDTVSQYNAYSGKISGINFDTFLIANAFSGDIQSSADKMYVNGVVSGIINKVPDDIFSGYYSISGGFWPTQNDLYQISYAMIGYSISSGVSVIPYTGIDTNNLGYSLVGYQVN
jgi:hypothetical protein